MPKYTFKSSLLSRALMPLGKGLIGCLVIFHVQSITKRVYVAYVTTVATATPKYPYYSCTVST